ncbi:MAG: TolC family protein [Gracilimonas sp.]
MNRYLSSTLLIALLLVASNAFAQEQRTISIQEAIEIALENNYQLEQARNNLNLADHQIRSEYADFLPSVNSSFNGSRQVGRRFDEVTGDITEDASHGISGSLSANITLFDGFNNINSLRSSQQSKISSEESFQRAKENTIFNTASNYLQVLVDTELLDIARENLENSQQQLEQVQAQVEVGSRPTVDLYNQEAQVANNELQVTQQENNVKFSKLVLVRQLQIDPLGTYEFVVPDAEFETGDIMGKSFELSELIDQALLNRSDLKSDIADIRSLEYQLRIAEGSLYPSISGSASISSRYSDTYRIPAGGSFEDVGFNDQFFDQQINRSFGLSLSIPIFQNWNRMYNIESSRVQLKNAELNLDNSRLQIIQEVTQAYNDYSSYIKQLEASEKSRRASERAFETQQERYNVGSSTLIELSQAQASYVEAQSNYTQAMYNLIFQEKLLDYYLGKLSGDSIDF